MHGLDSKITAKRLVLCHETRNNGLTKGDDGERKDSDVFEEKRERSQQRIMSK
jgi:hypothetical protein